MSRHRIGLLVVGIAISIAALLLVLYFIGRSGEPSPAPAVTPSATPTATPAVTPTATLTATPTLAPVATPTATLTATPTLLPTATAAPSPTPTVTPAATPTLIATEGFPIPEKEELESPELGTSLDDLVSRVESGDITEEEAAREAPLGRGKTVGIAIHLSGNVAGVVQFLEDNDVTPRHVGRDYIEAFVPVRLLRQISRMAGVLYIETIVPPQPSQLPQTIPGDGPSVHGTTAWNDAGFTGAGIKIGVIDLGFEGFSELMGTELPTTVKARCYGTETDQYEGLGGCGGGSSHGTAVAESIIDIAPEASLYLGAVRTKGDLHDTVEWMISEGVSVINMSLSWTFDGPGDGSAPSDRSPLNTVNEAVKAGIVWVNSAGNQARNTWFGAPSDLDGDGILEFSGGTELLAISSGRQVQLRWQGSWGGQTLDLDLYLYDANGKLIRRSFDPQKGGAGHNPYERVMLPGVGASVLQVGNRSGSLPDWIQIQTWGLGIFPFTESGSITNPGESANNGMLTVGAADWARPNTIEDFSSRGSTPDGRLKPDLVGADCGRTATSDRFCGTSQASPHVAGMAALVRQRFPDYTPQQVVQYLTENVEHRGGPGRDNTWGAGFAMLPPIQNIQATVSQDRDILVELYNTTDGPNWLDNTNWLSDRPIGEWYGVSTNEDGRVTRLELGNYLIDSLPIESGDAYEVGGNGLVGRIPPELGGLTDLQVLWLHGNQLSGRIPPELGNLANLVELALHANDLNGRIPPELGSLTDLQVLSLAINQLSGPIPPELGNLADLQGLWLQGNRLSGRIPPELGNPSYLQWLWLHDNRLSGPFPESFTGLDGLNTLVWYGTQLCAPTDAAFQAWLRGVAGRDGENCAAVVMESPDREALVALYNATNGPNWTNNADWLSDRPIEEWYGVTTNANGGVAELRLGENGLSGRIPAELGNLASLGVLELHENRLSGPIPAELGNLANLEWLWLGANQLSGPIPVELGNLANLRELGLYANQLSGRIPPGLGNLAGLEALALDNNGLSGPIPPQLGNLDSLWGLWLHVNQLRGPFPESFTGLDALDTLHWYGTRLCAPRDAAFQAWLRGVANTDGEDCAAPASPDRAALVALYNATGGPNWTDDTNWLSDEPIGEWYGVTTDGSGRVTELQLHENGLRGRIPPELGNLVNLRVLFLYRNQLSRPIPAELGNLANLQDLWLTSNQLSGPIPPELGNLANLQSLALDGNQLSGLIPAQLGNLANLHGLSLDGNQLSGRIPAELGNLVNLQGLWLHLNQFSGPLPDSFTGLRTLESLHWYDTELCAPTDASFQAWLRGVEDTAGENCAAVVMESPDRDALVALYNATDGPNWNDNTNWLSDRPIGEWSGVTTDSSRRVTELLLEFNGLSGRIPAVLGNLANLQWLRLHGNQLSGPIPPELGNLANLRELGLADNRLSGPIPPELGNLANLRVLALGINQLSGRIPPELGNLANLEWLELASNPLSGEIPPELGSLVNLRILQLRSNQLSGPLPDSFTGLDVLESFWWYNTQLCAPTDAAFQAWLSGVENTDGENCASAASSDRDVLLALYNATGGPNWNENINWLSDRPIGEWYGVTTDGSGRVTGLHLSSNDLSGQLPTKLGDLSELQTLQLQENQLSGPIPAELGNLAKLQGLWLSVNQLSGPIPAELGNLAKLSGLFLHENQLSGPIPAELGNLANLVDLSLDRNELSGPIPAELGNLANLRSLWLHENQLSGPLPDSFTGMDSLYRLEWHSTELCAPTDAAFQAWLRGVANTSGENCAATVSADRAALVALYNATNGDEWEESGNWLSDEPIGEWYGVSTDDNGRVTGLDLRNNNLSGDLSTELGDLSELEELELWGNSVSGEIPSTLGNLSRLRVLDLGSNLISGEIPSELGNLDALETLFLSGDFHALEGCIPEGLRDVPTNDLESLELSYCDASGT